MPKKIQPSPEIIAWTKRLDALLKECPPGHWLFAANNHLVVLRYKQGRERALTRDGGMDQAYAVGEASGLEIDGGDW